jgi:hypothetical protein
MQYGEAGHGRYERELFPRQFFGPPLDAESLKEATISEKLSPRPGSNRSEDEKGLTLALKKVLRRTTNIER